MPAFAYKWLKETSATGFLRFNRVPNQRVQDGYTRPWLCRDCEGRIGAWETPFATKIFHPLNDDGAQQIRYGEWLIKFCVSVSWRALLWMQQNNALHDLTGPQLESVVRALEVWGKLLLGAAANPGPFEQHLLPLDAIESSTVKNLPANANRYFLRTVAIDVVHSDNTTFVYTKLGKFLILGFIDVRFPKQWVGTKVHVSSGIVGSGEFTVPAEFGAYLVSKAGQLAQMHSEISATQRQKIEQAMWKDMDRVVRSASFTAMQHDVDRAGPAAFEVHAPKRKK